jgi:gamma-glutamyltranspeptidase / glutathione hydrolase
MDHVVAQDRLTPQFGKAGRSVTIASNGIVAASHPLAAQIGLDILKQGGNAMDAAIATSAAMGLMEPMSCGIGGDLFAIVWDAKSKKLHGLNANGAAPQLATIAEYHKRKYDEIPEIGPLSWSVPGCVDGWDQLRIKFGTMPFKTLLQPSIDYAENGFPVSEVIAGYWRGAERRLSQDEETASVFLVDGKSPRVGTLFRNPALAQSYRDIAEKGRDAFYSGRIADAIDAYSISHDGLLRKSDLEKHRSEWVQPVSTNYRGYDVWELPPPGQGISALQMLNSLEGFDLRKMGPNSLEYWHHLIEAKKLAYADRAKYYADPRFAKVHVKELISKEYGKLQQHRINPAKALTNLEAGDPKLGKADTIYLCVVDKDRNCVSLIQSNYFGFGSGLAPKAVGFALQNRGNLFALDPNHANRLEPGKRPFHTIIPAMVTQNGEPRFTYGVMGGDMQPQGHVQVLLNIVEFGLNVQAAGEAPRIEHVGSATPTGRPESPPGGIVKAEQGISLKVIEGLRALGHQVDIVPRNGGGYQGIWIDAKTKLLHGGTEARKDGAAVGY